MMRLGLMALLMAGAASEVVAADKSVPSSLLPSGMRSISVTLTKERPAPRRGEPSKKAFLRSLSAPIGGRLE